MNHVTRGLSVLLTFCFVGLFAGCTDGCGYYLGIQRLEDGSTLICGACRDVRRANVIRVSSDGSEIWSYRYPESRLKWPHCAFLNSDDTVIIADTLHDRVIIVDTVTQETIWNSRNITFSDERVSFNYANHASILPNGNILSSIRDAHLIVEYQLDGTIVWSFGEWSVAGNDDTHLNGPHWPQRLPNGNTLIPDSWNHRIIEVNPAGEIVWRYKPTEQPYCLAWPRCAQEGPNGNILITDPHDYWEITRAGEVVKHFARRSNTGNWGYSGLMLDNGNYLLNGVYRVDELTPEGEIIWTHASSLINHAPPWLVE